MQVNRSFLSEDSILRILMAQLHLLRQLALFKMSTGHYKIQFVSCSCANVDRSETKKNYEKSLIETRL